MDQVKDGVYAALLEPVEQQTVSIAKAEIQTVLKTRASVLAAANPSGGRFYRDEEMLRQVPLPVELLSRFDLIYFLVDERCVAAATRTQMLHQA